MVCVYCGGGTQVVNSRLQRRPNQVWRRRKCMECGAIFSTHESAAYAAAWRVKTAKSKLVPFAKNKLLLSVYKSCEHRPKALDDAAELSDTIIARLQPKASSGVIEAKDIAQITHETLKRFDKAASVHYKAFHPF